VEIRLFGKKLSRKGKRFFGGVLGGLLVILVLACMCSKCSRSEGDSKEAEVVEETWDPMDYLVRFNHLTPNYSSFFNDMNPKHLEAAGVIGLKAIPSSREDVKHDHLELVEDCEYYYLDTLEYSVPYLVPKAKAELDRIGAAFAAKLAEAGMPDYKFMVTSVLRTQEDVTNLRRVNVNASANSAHCYGTTWDISYFTFMKTDESSRYWTYNDDLKVALAEVLREEQQAGRLYCKYEKVESCFHMTAR